MSDDRTASAHGLSNIPASQDHRPLMSGYEEGSMQSWYGQKWYLPSEPKPTEVSSSVSISGPDVDVFVKSIAELTLRMHHIDKSIAELELRVRRIEDVQRLGKRR